MTNSSALNTTWLSENYGPNHIKKKKCQNETPFSFSFCICIMVNFGTVVESGRRSSSFGYKFMIYLQALLMHNILFLLLLVFSIKHSDNEEILGLAILINLISILFDIIILCSYYPRFSIKSLNQHSENKISVLTETELKNLVPSLQFFIWCSGMKFLFKKKTCFYKFLNDSDACQATNCMVSGC